MTCDKRGQDYDPNENPKFRECPGHGAFRIGPAVLRPGVIEPEHVLCGRCGKSFGDVGELIEAKERADKCYTFSDRLDVAINMGNMKRDLIDAEKAIAALTRERDEAREQQAESEHSLLSLNEYYLGRIAELEKAELKLQSVKGGDSMVIKANGTWEWRKV